MIYSGEIDYEKKYKEALEKARKTLEKSSAKDAAKLVVEYFFPELAESEDERIRKAIIELLKEVGQDDTGISENAKCMITYLEKQKENIEKEYVFRPLTGTDINTAVLQAIRRANEGDRLVLAFNGAYIPVRKGVDANKIVDIYDAFVEKKKEQKPSSKFRPNDWAVYDGPLGHAILQVKDVIDGRYTFVDNDSTLLVEDSDKFLRPLTPRDVEKKAEWSEEDADILNCCISSIEEAKENRYAYKETDGDTSYDREIDWLKSLRPSWKPSEDEERLMNTTISFLKDFADKGYENAVECIDWLKSKLNGNTCE